MQLILQERTFPAIPVEREKKTGIPTILKLYSTILIIVGVFVFISGYVPGHCHSTELEMDKEYFVLAAVYLDVYKPVLGEIKATQANLAEVVRACGLTPRYPPDLHPMDAEQKCPIPVSRAECIDLPSSVSSSRDADDDTGRSTAVAIYDIVGFIINYNYGLLIFVNKEHFEILIFFSVAIECLSINQDNFSGKTHTTSLFVFCLTCSKTTFSKTIPSYL